MTDYNIFSFFKFIEDYQDLAGFELRTNMYKTCSDSGANLLDSSAILAYTSTIASPNKLEY